MNAPEPVERTALQVFLDHLVSASKITWREADILHAALQSGRGIDAWDEAACRRISGTVWSWRQNQVLENRVYVLDQLETVPVARWLAMPLVSFVADLMSYAEAHAVPMSDNRIEYLKAIFCACIMQRNPPRPVVTAASRDTIVRPKFPESPAPVSHPRR